LGTTKNKIAIVKATFEALKSFKRHSAPVKKFEMAKKEEVAVEAKAEEKKPAKKAASKKA
jgi:ribosomal protein S5